jgi:hypothetical protein
MHKYLLKQRVKIIPNIDGHDDSTSFDEKFVFTH